MVIGYRGIEASDIIMYTSRIIRNLGYRILICDYSPVEELEYYIPLYNQINLKTDCIDYRGVEFTKQPLTEKLKKNFDVILIQFGFLGSCLEIGACDYIVYVSDTNKAHLKKLATLKLEDDICNNRKFVIKEDIPGVRLNFYIKEIKEALKITTSYSIKISKKDEKINQLMQYNDKFRFHGISRGFYNYLVVSVTEYFSSTNIKEITQSVNRAMKGE